VKVVISSSYAFAIQKALLRTSSDPVSKT